MYRFGTLIHDEWVNGDLPSFETLNPARPADVCGTYSPSSAVHIGQAVESARDAQRLWRDIPPVVRTTKVLAFLEAIAARSEDIVTAITYEQGKPLTESRNEIGKALRESKQMCAASNIVSQQAIASQRPAVRNSIVRRPRGIVAAITPWNFPILTPMRKIAPALCFGNAIILKPSEYSPATACLVAECAKGIIPPGLLQIVQGSADCVQSLVSHPAVNAVTFTGSVSTGKAVYALAAQNLAEISLELGGKNAAIVNDTDDLEGCLDQISGAAFMCTGQRCTAISRVLVKRSLESMVLKGLARRADNYVLGNGAQEGVTMGPLTNANQWNHVQRAVAAGLRQGASAICGADTAEIADCDGGYFYKPTILGSVQPNHTTATDEIFGPVISVVAYDQFDEALEILNSVEFGLTSALFSNELHCVESFINHSENGMLHVNHGTIPDDHMPFGGIKNSGVGAYSVGSSAASFYTTEHSVYVQHR